MGSAAKKSPKVMRKWLETHKVTPKDPSDEGVERAVRSRLKKIFGEESLTCHCEVCTAPVPDFAVADGKKLEEFMITCPFCGSSNVDDGSSGKTEKESKKPKTSDEDDEEDEKPVKPAKKPADDEDEDEEEKPSKPSKKPADDEDEDEEESPKPVKKPKTAADEEDEEPAKGSFAALLNQMKAQLKKEGFSGAFALTLTIPS